MQTIFVFLEGNTSTIGFVKARIGCSYADLRGEIESDELEALSRSRFVFLGDRSTPLSSKQEERYTVTTNDVYLRIVDVRVDVTNGIEDPKAKRARITIEEIEEDGGDECTEKPAENSAENTGKMQSKLVTRVQLRKWNKAFDTFIRKLRQKGRLDRFELMTSDVEGKAKPYIWCVECSTRYGTGGKDTIRNFFKSHCCSRTHEENYERHVLELKISEISNVERLEDVVQKNKLMVDKCMTEVVLPFIEKSGVLFEVYEPSLFSYEDHEKICIACVLCERTLSMFPKAGSLEHNMEEHLGSSRHAKATFKAKREDHVEHAPKAKVGGRPPKIISDAKQLNLLKFMTRATTTRIEDASSSDQFSYLEFLCWGYWQSHYRYGTYVHSLKPFLDESRSGHHWYCEPNLHASLERNGEEISINGTFRHIKCCRISNDGKPFDNYQCLHCAKIPKERDFYMRVQRQIKGCNERGERAPSSRIRVDYLTQTEMLITAKGARTEVRRLKKELFFCRQRVVTLSVRARTIRESLSESMNRKDVKKFCADITEAHYAGKFDGKPGLWDFLTDIAQNIIRPGHKRRYKSTTKELFETIKIWGGRRMHNFLSINFGGPSISTTMRSTRKNFTYSLGIHESTFVHLAKTYRKHMKELSLSEGYVPVIVAEDETVIKSSIRWVARDDALIGFCGPMQDHKCDASFVVVVGSKDTGYNTIAQAFEQNLIARYGRVFIVNPLHARLPKLVLAIQLTCNKFDAADVRKQWKIIHHYWNLHLEHVIGPLIGHSSDGDARRRKCMVEDYTGLKGQGKCYAIPWEGWVFNATVRDNGGVYGLHDQDFIHNGKKLVNPLDNASRRLYVGRDLATLNDVWHVFKTCQGHGLEIGDVERKDRQNWRAAQRISSRKVQMCLKSLREGSHNPPMRTLGTETYLSIVSLYIDIFLSPYMDLRARVKAAATVSFFLRLWRLWILNHDTHSLKKNFISRETFMDIQLSCHYVVLLIRYFRDNCKDIPVPLHCTGSDACENFFSKVGGMVRNERSYDGADLLESASALNRVAEFQALSKLIFPAAHAKQENIWQLMEKRLDENGKEICADLTDYTNFNTDDNIVEALKEGFLTAKGMCKIVGIACTDNNDGTCWWEAPWKFEDFFHQDYYEQLETAAHIEDESDLAFENDEGTQLALDQESEAEKDDDIAAKLELSHVFDEMLDDKDYGAEIQVERHVEIDGKLICKATLVSQLNGSPWLSKDRLQKVKSNVYPLILGQKLDAATLLGIGSDCAVYFEIETKPSMQTRKRKCKEDSSLKRDIKEYVWYLGRVLSMRRKFGRSWKESREPIDLGKRPSYEVQINLAWYNAHEDSTRRNFLFTYDLSDSQDISLESIISLACLTYDPLTHKYSLDAKDKVLFDDFIKEQQKGLFN